MGGAVIDVYQLMFARVFLAAGCGGLWLLAAHCRSLRSD